ncbi:hypothetical protein C0992_005484 [Termitomyces sp. T32_za158]|nr:hypothetical protein C0992_005484 [Termitomyces sp. T32_za158]
MMMYISKDAKAISGLILHPSQAGLYLKFDASVSIAGTDRRSSIQAPFGYHAFAKLFNAVPADQYKYRLAEYNATTKEWIIPEHCVIPGSIYTNFFDRERYRLIQIALDQPFDDIYRWNAYFQKRDEERSALHNNGEAYFSTGEGDDLLTFWENHPPTLTLGDQLQLMVAAFDNPATEGPFAFDITSPPHLSGPSATSELPAPPTVHSNGTLDADVNMGALTNEFLTELEV